jgi:hypothetical protein
MTTAAPFALRTGTADEPEPNLTSTVVVHRAMRQDLRQLATGGRRVRILVTAARPGYAQLERQAFGVSPALRYQR